MVSRNSVPLLFFVSCVVLVICGAGLRGEGSSERVVCRQVKARRVWEVSDVVFTGTVRQIYTSGGDTYSSAVLVKRVLKGDAGLVDETVTVEGLGDKRICDTDVRPRDTWIFSADSLAPNYMRLNGSLEKVTLNNLDYMDALMKQKPYIRRPPIVDEPCEKKYCPYNGDCYVDKRTGRAQCRCPSSCLSAKYEPVCGSDGVTYSSECRLRVESCAQKKRVFVRRIGECGASRPTYSRWTSSRNSLPRYEL